MTNRTVLKQEDIKASTDIQITSHELTPEQQVEKKYLPLKNGFFDSTKHSLELNYQGAVCT